MCTMNDFGWTAAAIQPREHVGEVGWSTNEPDEQLESLVLTFAIRFGPHDLVLNAPFFQSSEGIGTIFWIIKTYSVSVKFNI
jgi:hypothetical protein